MIAKKLSRPKTKKERDGWTKYIWRQYGLTPEDVVQMYAEQGGTCACCPSELADHKWVIDHKHAPGYKRMPPEERRKFVRGLVCIYCNWKVLGQLERAGRERIVRACRYLGFISA